MIVTFCGYRDRIITPALKEWLYRSIAAQILAGADQFYPGGCGSFDRAAASAVREAKKAYPHIRSTLILPYPDRKVDASLYDDTEYPPLEAVPRRYAIVMRNRWMIDAADVVIADVERGWGGAAEALEYAKKKKKTVINCIVDVLHKSEL